MLKYPYNQRQNEDNSPFLLFTPIKATYTTGSQIAAGGTVTREIATGGNNTGQTIARVVDGRMTTSSVKSAIVKETVKLDDAGTPAIGMYLPRGVQFADTINYNNIQNPLLVNALTEIRDMMQSEEGIQVPDAAKTTAYLARSSVGGEFLSAVRRNTLQSAQQIVNPREFALFDAPQLRSFTLAFKMMPESNDESNMCAEIIRTFRASAYPTFSNDTSAIYNFPKAFRIKYSRNVNEAHMIKFPEVVLTNVSVQYNANSMSYYQTSNGFTPLEIDLSLTFNELLPQSSIDIQKGY